jgi:hypothetical protein
MGNIRIAVLLAGQEPIAVQPAQSLRRDLISTALDVYRPGHDSFRTITSRSPSSARSNRCNPSA